MPRVGGSGMDVELQMTCLVYLRAATALGTSKRVPGTGSFPGTLSQGPFKERRTSKEQQPYFWNYFWHALALSLKTSRNYASPAMTSTSGQDDTKGRSHNGHNGDRSIPGATHSRGIHGRPCAPLQLGNIPADGRLTVGGGQSKMAV